MFMSCHAISFTFLPFGLISVKVSLELPEPEDAKDIVLPEIEAELSHG